MKILLIGILILQKLCLIIGQDEISPDDIKCPPDQEVGCSNYCLEKTCANAFYNGEPPRICPLYCLIGCVCKMGFVLANGDSRNCVKIDNCPKICCPVNRVYNDCGPFEPRSCDNRELVICNDQDNCNKGCFCRDGLVEDGFGNCIPEENCPTRCGENEIEDICMNVNQPTCSNPNPPVCDSYPCQRGCVCKPPYIRNDATGQCIDRNTCIRPKCSVNQIFKQSGFDCWTCRNYRVVRCALITTPQCFCLDDYVHHDITGKCIPKSECPPPVCPPNQTFTDDGSRDCQTCSNWQLIDCVPNNTPGCYCNDGYVHTDTDKKDCIAIEDCPKTTCGINEIFADEGVDGVTCENYTYVKFAPQKISKCYCILDYVRNAQNICTAKANCPW